MKRKVEKTILFALALIGLGAGCASGPAELLDELVVEEVACGSGARCAAEGIEALQQQDFVQAMAFFHQGCRAGETLACRRLGDGYARGDGGVVDLEAASNLYGWACFKGDGPACHSLGELERLRAGAGEQERARAAFVRACEVGEVTGCHDQMLVALEMADQAEQEKQEEAAQLFEELCRGGFLPACTNFANLLARGLGVAGKDHRQALVIFEKTCARAQSWQEHPLAPLAKRPPEKEPELFRTSQYDGEAPCRQLEALATGSFEERVITAFAAEEEALLKCYAEAREPEREQVGRITVEADIGADGQGRALKIVSDTLGKEAVRSCVERSMGRHLIEGGAGEARYQVRFDLSFIHGPSKAEAEEEAPPGCDPREVRRALEQVTPDIQQCGRRLLAAPEGEPGVVLVRWSFGQDGRIESMVKNTTLEDEETLQCLQSRLQEMAIPPFDRGGCPVQAPFVFSRGERLHFTLISR